MRFNVSKIAESDLETRVEWINNPMIHSSMYFDIPATVEKTRQWYEISRNNRHRIDLVFRDNSGIIVSMSGLTSIDYSNKNAEFYIMVNPKLQGKGIGKEVSLWTINYGFSKFDLHKVYLSTNEENIKAYKIYESLGFKIEGILRDHKFKDGKFTNRRLYGLLRSEWQKLNWKQHLSDVL